ncbi:MAG: class IV adenylate cyclase [Crenarchaeota archaeon]|nr:class IV adenylate cyclase [Thermoproteota archaeon]
MFEVEVKYRVPEELYDKIVRELESKWKFMYEVEEHDIYLAHPCRNFAETDEALRIRTEKRGNLHHIILTYKGPRIGGEGKTREELSTEVGDLESCLKIFEKLGFRKVVEILKRRKVYSKESYTLALDDVEGLGKFVEIECVTDSRDLVDECARNIKRLAAELGLDDSLIERRTYLELMLEKKPLY